jgi:D-alanyl-D-alanine carboxypeptidase
MRSGLFPYTSDPDFVTALESNPHRQWTPQQLLSYAFKHPNTFPPGTATQYSNTNYILLGLVIERVTHRPLAEVLRDRVFEPSHLHHTLFPRGAEFPDPKAQGYTDKTLTGQVADATSWNTSFAWAAGAMISDLRDLRLWVKDVATGTLLSPATQAQRTDFLPTGLPGVSYGLGLFDVNGWIGHDGSIPGYQSLPIYLPEQHATLVVLVNTDISHDGVAPTTSLGKAITSIVSPGHIYAIPALT